MSRAPDPGVPCARPDRSVCARSSQRRTCGPDRALERRHLRPRGRRDRERRRTCRSGCRPASAGEIKRAGGDAIEFAAVRQAPVPLGEAIVTPAGRLAARAVIHAVSLDRDRRTSAETSSTAPSAARWPAPARSARIEHRLPGARHGRRRLPARRGRPDHRPRRPRRAARSPPIEHVTFAMRGAAAYQAFEAALAEPTERRRRRRAIGRPPAVDGAVLA